MINGKGPAARLPALPFPYPVGAYLPQGFIAAFSFL
jgi:hypothetical protein